MRDLPHSLQYVLSVVEERFLVDADQPRSQIGCSSLDELAKEEVASAASYAIARYRDVYGVDGRDIAGASFTWGDDRRPMDLARDLVLLAFRLNRVRDVEASVYRMSYSCKCEGQLAFTVLPPVERFGMALELGYIRTAMMARPALDHPQPEAARFSDLCNGWVTRFGNQYLRIAEGPPRRLQLAIHEPVARILGQELLLSQGMFAEDVLALESECYELGTTGETLDQIRVTEHLTLFDLFRVHRLFRFVAVVRRAKLNELREAEPPVYLNSLLGEISREDLVQLLEAHGLSPAQAREYLDLVTWDASAGNAFLDLQYSPFLQVGDLLCLPFALHARSDVVRNTLFRTKARIYADGTLEPMVVDLADAFRGRTNTVETNVDYGAGLGEIDVVALLDDGLYIFECKNTLLPTSAFEQRTLHDCLEKASMQLDRFRTAWEDRAVRSALEQKLGWDLAGVAAVHTTIVLSNRLLSGADFRGHPIRHHRELANLLTTGKGRIIVRQGEKTEEVTISLWRQAEFSKGILDEYLSTNSALYASLWAAMHSAFESIEFPEAKLRLPRYALDPAAHARELAQRGFLETSWVPQTSASNAIEVNGGDPAE